jgi:hypothetical protein
MYLCEGQRQKLYLKNRAKQEVNDERQQEVVDFANAERLGIEMQTQSLSKLAKGIFSSIANETSPIVTKAGQTMPTLAKQISAFGSNLLSVVKQNKLSEFVKAFENVDLSKQKVSPKLKIIQKDLKNPELKNIINEEVAKVLNDMTIDIEKKDADIKQIVIDYAAGGDSKVMDEAVDVVNRSRSSSVGSNISETFSDAPTELTNMSYNPAELGGNTEKMLALYENDTQYVNVLKEYLRRIVTQGGTKPYITKNGKPKKIGKTISKTHVDAIVEVLPPNIKEKYDIKLSKLGSNTKETMWLSLIDSYPELKNALTNK